MRQRHVVIGTQLAGADRNARIVCIKNLPDLGDRYRFVPETWVIPPVWVGAMPWRETSVTDERLRRSLKLIEREDVDDELAA